MLGLALSASMARMERVLLGDTLTIQGVCLRTFHLHQPVE